MRRCHIANSSRSSSFCTGKLIAVILLALAAATIMPGIAAAGTITWAWKGTASNGATYLTYSNAVQVWGTGSAMR